MPLNESTSAGFPQDSHGVTFEADSGAVVDNIFVFQDSAGTKWQRVIEGGEYRAAWAGIFADGVTDYAAEMQSLLTEPSIKTIILDYPDGGGVRMEGPIVATGKTIHFAPGTYITGDCQITGGTYTGSISEKWFDTSVDLADPLVETPFFPVRAYGATGDGVTNDHAAIQKAVDTVILNRSLPRDVYFLPDDTYRILSPILCQNFDSNTLAYRQVNVCLVGNYDSGAVKFSGRGATINCASFDTFAIGFQNCKSGGVKSMVITGQYVPPSFFMTLLEFYNTAFDDYIDPNTRDERYSPYAGIVVDPWRASGGITTPDGGYPGMSIYYTQGDSDGSGSSGLVFKDLYISGFVVCGIHTPNDDTQNDECMTWDDAQFANCKVGISSSQAQEKSNVWRNLVCWGHTHTILTNTHYGSHFDAGNMNLHGLNVAGQVYQILDWSCGGTMPSYFNDIYAESFGRVGRISTSGVACKIANSLLDVTRPQLAGGSYVEYHVYATRGVIFESCVLRVYNGELFPMVLTGDGAIYKHCTFEVPPHVPLVDELVFEGPRFQDCTLSLVNGVIGVGQNIVGKLNQLTGLSSYGRYKVADATQAVNGYSIEYEFSGDRVRSQANLSSYAITISGSPREFTFTALFGLQEFCHQYYSIVLYDGVNTYKFGGIVTEVSGTDVTVTHVPVDIADGTYFIFVCAPLYLYGFFGDTTSGNADITNCAYDDFAAVAGNTIWSDLFYGFCKIKTIVSTTVTMAIGAQQTTTRTYFSPWGAKKRYRTLKGVQTDLIGNPAAISATTIFPIGSEIIDSQYGRPFTYECMATGYWNQVPYAVFSGLPFTLSADGSRQYPANCKVTYLVKPASDLANFKIGTTNGGEEISPAQMATGGVWNEFNPNLYNENLGTVYFGGIGAVSTQIKMICQRIA